MLIEKKKRTEFNHSNPSRDTDSRNNNKSSGYVRFFNNVKDTKASIVLFKSQNLFYSDNEISVSNNRIENILLTNKSILS